MLHCGADMAVHIKDRATAFSINPCEYDLQEGDHLAVVSRNIIVLEKIAKDYDDGRDEGDAGVCTAFVWPHMCRHLSVLFPSPFQLGSDSCAAP